MHLAVCFQTNQHVREARAPLSTWVEETAHWLGEPQILKCMCLLSRASHTTAFPDAGGGEEEKTLGSEIQGKWLCQTSEPLLKRGVD